MSDSRLRTKKDKIEFLKDLMKGRRTARELLPVQQFVTEFEQTDENKFIQIESSKIFNREEFNVYEKTNPNKFILILNGI